MQLESYNEKQSNVKIGIIDQLVTNWWQLLGQIYID